MPSMTPRWSPPRWYGQFWPSVSIRVFGVAHPPQRTFLEFESSLLIPKRSNFLLTSPQYWSLNAAAHALRRVGRGRVPHPAEPAGAWRRKPTR